MSIYEVAGEGKLSAELLPTTGIHLLTIALTLGLLVVYIIDVFKNKKVKNDIKALWAIILILGNVIAMPIYWYLYIWRAE